MRHRSWRPAERDGVWAVAILLQCRGLPKKDGHGPPLALLREVVEEYVLPLLHRSEFELLASLGQAAGGSCSGSVTVVED